MKKLKKVILCMLCVGVLCSTTGCGSNTKDDAANNTTTDKNTTTDPTKDNNGDGVIDDLGNAVKDGVDDVEKGVDNVRDGDRKSTRLNSSHSDRSRMPSSA